MWSTGRLTSTKVFKWYSWLCGAAWALLREPLCFCGFDLFCFGIWWFQYMMWNCHKNTITVCLFSSNTSALNTSRLGLIVCEWIERDSKSQITISPKLHRLITLQSSSHSKPITSPEIWNSLMHWFKILSDKKNIYTKAKTVQVQYRVLWCMLIQTIEIDASCLPSCLTY